MLEVKTIESAEVLSILFSNPPVNAMSPGVPDALIEALSEAEANGFSAVLLVPGGNGVLAGADVKMHGIPWPDDARLMSDLIAAIDASKVPVAILLRGDALGGGLEIAMACRWRLAAPGIRLGQPEVNLGIPPGAGGTQRLPRIVGAERALDMIVTGKPVTAEEAERIGLVDRILSGSDKENEAIAFLKAALASGSVPDPVMARPVNGCAADVIAAARAKATRIRRGETAPIAAIEAVEVAGRLPFSEGLARERALYLECVASDQAAAMRHVFFAERRAQKGHVPQGTDVREVKHVGVVGAGTMGVGIALSLLASGFRVHIRERSEDAITAGRKRILGDIERQVQKGRLGKGDAGAIIDRFTMGTNGADFAECDLVVEAAFEDIDVKREIFAELAEITQPGSLLATNTSYLDVDVIAVAAGARASDVLGLHFFSPAQIMPLLEIVRGRETSDVALATALHLAKSLGKTGIVSGVCHGFIANRTFEKYLREAEFLLGEGATPTQVDTVLTQFGLPMGPFAVRDLAGLDIGWAKRKATAHLRDPELRYSTIGDLICERGWYGQKTGRGFYRYVDGARKGVEDPEVLDLIASVNAETGIQQREVTDIEIIDRCLLSVVNEGAKILEEGIARTAADIDLAWIHGYGFPRWRGGPMYWADTLGLDKVLDRIRAFDVENDYWEPSQLLVRLAEGGETFSTFEKDKT